VLLELSGRLLAAIGAGIKAFGTVYRLIRQGQQWAFFVKSARQGKRWPTKQQGPFSK
jgi:hypothetical protein